LCVSEEVCLIFDENEDNYMNETELANIEYTATYGDKDFVEGKTFIPLSEDSPIKC